MSDSDKPGARPDIRRFDVVQVRERAGGLWTDLTVVRFASDVDALLAEAKSESGYGISTARALRVVRSDFHGPNQGMRQLVVWSNVPGETGRVQETEKLA